MIQFENLLFFSPFTSPSVCDELYLFNINKYVFDFKGLFVDDLDDTCNFNKE